MGQSVMPTDAQLDYMLRSGDKYIDGTNYVENEHGFASWVAKADCIHVIQVYGDGKYWDRFFRELAKEHGVNSYLFYTRRNPKAFARKFGAKTVQTIMQVEV
mgnify:FL=1